jgi:hypothetical protein
LKTVTIVSGGRNAIVKKLSPNGHLVLAWRPSPYAKTPQQIRAGNVARECGIHKGISRNELRQKMISCVGPKMRGH